MLICFFSVCVIDAVSATHLAITWHQFLEEEALSNVIVPRPQDLLVWYIRCVLHPKYAFQQPYPLHAFQKKKKNLTPPSVRSALSQTHSATCTRSSRKLSPILPSISCGTRSATPLSRPSLPLCPIRSPARLRFRYYPFTVKVYARVRAPVCVLFVVICAYLFVSDHDRQEITQILRDLFTSVGQPSSPSDVRPLHCAYSVQAPVSIHIVYYHRYSYLYLSQSLCCLSHCDSTFGWI